MHHQRITTLQTRSDFTSWIWITNSRITGIFGTWRGFHCWIQIPGFCVRFSGNDCNSTTILLGWYSDQGLIIEHSVTRFIQPLYYQTLLLVIKTFSSRYLVISYPSSKPKCWVGMSFCMQLGNSLEIAKLKCFLGIWDKELSVPIFFLRPRFLYVKSSFNVCFCWKSLHVSIFCQQ